jgi:hypothetical protein
MGVVNLQKWNRPPRAPALYLLAVCRAASSCQESPNPPSEAGIVAIIDRIL